MSLKNINNNQELVNAYKNFQNTYSAYLALPEKQKGEMDGLKDTLIIFRKWQATKKNRNYRTLKTHWHDNL